MRTYKVLLYAALLTGGLFSLDVSLAVTLKSLKQRRQYKQQVSNYIKSGQFDKAEEGIKAFEQAGYPRFAIDLREELGKALSSGGTSPYDPALLKTRSGQQKAQRAIKQAIEEGRLDDAAAGIQFLPEKLKRESYQGLVIAAANPKKQESLAAERAALKAELNAQKEEKEARLAKEKADRERAEEERAQRELEQKERERLEAERKAKEAASEEEKRLAQRELDRKKAVEEEARKKAEKEKAERLKAEEDAKREKEEATAARQKADQKIQDAAEAKRAEILTLIEKSKELKQQAQNTYDWIVKEIERGAVFKDRSIIGTIARLHNEINRTYYPAAKKLVEEVNALTTVRPDISALNGIRQAVNASLVQFDGIKADIEELIGKADSLLKDVPAASPPPPPPPPPAKPQARPSTEGSREDLLAAIRAGKELKPVEDRPKPKQPKKEDTSIGAALREKFKYALPQDEDEDEDEDEDVWESW